MRSINDIKKLQTPVAIVFDEKHDRRVLVLSSYEEIFNAALFVLKERLEDGYYDDEGIKPQEILDEKNGARALIFLYSRRGHEYEDMTIYQRTDLPNMLGY